MEATDIPLSTPRILGGNITANLKTLGIPENECIEKWILENPQSLISLQSEFVNSGANIIYAPTYYANSERLSKYSLENDLVRINSELVALSKKSAGSKALVAGTISSTGRLPAPYGDMDFFDMFSVFYRQARALFEAKADLFAIERIDSLTEVRAAFLACKRFDIPVFVTLSVDEEGNTASGTSALSALICLQEMGISAFGVEFCGNFSVMREIIGEIAAVSKIPLIAKFCTDYCDENSKFSLSPEDFAQTAASLIESGVSYIGAGFGVTPSHIKAACEKCHQKESYTNYNNELDDMLVLSNETQVFYLSPDNIEISEYIQCTQDMSDILLELNDTSIDIIGVEIFSHDDAVLFMQNAHMASLPVIFRSQSITALTTALILYPGRACIDSRCDLSKDELYKLSQKYGAIVY